jgi:hypothetical protein
MRRLLLLITFFFVVVSAFPSSVAAQTTVVPPEMSVGYGYYLHYFGSNKLRCQYEGKISEYPYNREYWLKLNFTALDGVSYADDGTFIPINGVLLRSSNNNPYPTGQPFLRYNLRRVSDSTNVINSAGALKIFRVPLTVAWGNETLPCYSVSGTYADMIVTSFEFVPHLKPKCAQIGAFNCLKNHLSSKFPFDLLAPPVASGSACPKVSFFEKEFDICWLDESIKLLKYPVVVALLIKMVQFL